MLTKYRESNASVYFHNPVSYFTTITTDYDSGSLICLKTGLHEDEISNEPSNNERWRDVGPHCCSKGQPFHHNQTLLDRNEVWDTPGNYWTTKKLIRFHYLPANCYYRLGPVTSTYLFSFPTENPPSRSWLYNRKTLHLLLLW